MRIKTDDSFVGVEENNALLSSRFTVLQYKDGAISFIPKNFFETWQGAPPDFGEFFIDKCSGVSAGSTVKYDHDQHKLNIGRYVSIGQRVRFVLNGTHNIHTPTSYMLGIQGATSANISQLGDTVVENDVWIGDEAMVMGGVTIGNGCVVGARSLVTQGKVLEPYGIYVGNPAKLLRYRFDEKIIALLLQLEWWKKPLDWVKKHEEFFCADLTTDIGQSAELIQAILEQR